MNRPLVHFAAWDPFGVIAVASGKFRTLVDIGEDAPFAGKACCFHVWFDPSTL